MCVLVDEAALDLNVGVQSHRGVIAVVVGRITRVGGDASRARVALLLLLAKLLGIIIFRIRIIPSRRHLLALLREVAVHADFILGQLALRQDALLIRVVLVVLHLRLVDDLVDHTMLLGLISIESALLGQVFVQSTIIVP